MRLEEEQIQNKYLKENRLKILACSRIVVLLSPYYQKLELRLVSGWYNEVIYISQIGFNMQFYYAHARCYI